MPGLCSQQQSCPPQAVGTLQIVDYGEPAAPIYGFSFEVTIPTDSTGGGGGAGKATFTDIGVTRIADALSPRLLLDAATGRHLKLVNIVVKQGSSSESSYRLTNVSISRVSSGTEMEEVAFSYSRIEFSAAGRQMCFDLASNTSC